MKRRQSAERRRLAAFIVPTCTPFAATRTGTNAPIAAIVTPTGARGLICHFEETATALARGLAETDTDTDGHGHGHGHVTLRRAHAQVLFVSLGLLDRRAVLARVKVASRRLRRSLRCAQRTLTRAPLGAVRGSAHCG